MLAGIPGGTDINAPRYTSAAPTAPTAGWDPPCPGRWPRSRPSDKCIWILNVLHATCCCIDWLVWSLNNPFRPSLKKKNTAKKSTHTLLQGRLCVVWGEGSAACHFSNPLVCWWVDFLLRIVAHFCGFWHLLNCKQKKKNTFYRPKFAVAGLEVPLWSKLWSIWRSAEKLTKSW